MGGVAELDWKRRSATELDWMWVCRRFEVGLEEMKLKSCTADSRLWVRRCLALHLWVWFLLVAVFLWLDLEEKKLDR